MHRKLLASVISVAVLGFAGLAQAANVTSLEPQTMVVALQNSGYKAILSKTKDGDPIIETASNGFTVFIVMTDCEDHKACATSEFVGIWDCKASVEKCRQVALATNGSESPVHVLMSDDGKTATTYAYLLYDKVGISEELFIRNLTTFSHYNTEFTRAVAEK